MTNDDATTDPAVVHTPDGETYTLDECEIEYPIDCGVDYALEHMSDEGAGPDMRELFQFIDEHQFGPIVEMVTQTALGPSVQREVSIQAIIDDLSWRDVLALLARQDVTVEADITPWVAMGVMFGTSLERDYPSFTTDDQGWVEDREDAGLPPEPSPDEIEGDDE